MDDENKPVLSDVENEPTPYALSDAGSGSGKGPKRGLTPPKKRLFVLLAAAAVVAISIAGFLIVRSQGRAPIDSAPPVLLPSATSTASAAAPQTPPSISIEPQKTGGGVRLLVQWNDLPTDTDRINIFYSATMTGEYRLIGNVPVSSSSTASGTGYLGVPDGYQNGYYYGVATGESGNPLWTSSSTSATPSSPGESSSGNNTNPNNGANENNNPPENGTEPTGTPANNSSGTDSQQNNDTNEDQTQSPSDAPNFVVQHNDGKIQVSWQSLPAGTYQVVVSRSASSTGPWTPVLTETDITTDGPYSIELVDDTLGDAYYYEMNIEDQDGNVITTYGPTLLGPLM